MLERKSLSNWGNGSQASQVYQCHFAPRIHDFLLFPKCQKYSREKAHKLTKESISVCGENKISYQCPASFLISLCCSTAIYEMVMMWLLSHYMKERTSISSGITWRFHNKIIKDLGNKISESRKTFLTYCGDFLSPLEVGF